MIHIGDKLISQDIFEKKFVCNLEACKGGCCVHGDSGAPLTEEETKILETEYENISNYLSPGGRDSIGKHGKWVVDTDHDRVTPLIGNSECAYTVFENGIARCGIENAWREGKTTFRKPISCHLYPIRVSRVGSYTALNYHQWSICQPACISGTKLGVPVFKFLKEAIQRAWGEEFYSELEEVATQLGKL